MPLRSTKSFLESMPPSTKMCSLHDLDGNGDPCVPPVHPWYSINCGFDATAGAWFICGLNLSNNFLTGSIPSSLGNISTLVTWDLSHNNLNGSIPASLGQVPHLQELLLNNNQLSGEVPPALGAFPIPSYILNLANNDGLCGVGIRDCHKVSAAAKIGIGLAIAFGIVAFFVGGYLCWKRQQNIARGGQRLPRDVPYAKARTTFVCDVKMARIFSQTTSVNSHPQRTRIQLL